jgi:hypothetical protein
MKLTLGMACYNDFHGVYFTVQSALMHSARKPDEIIIVDNNPSSPHGHAIQGMAGWNSGIVKYIPWTEHNGTAGPRNHIFSVATGDVVCVIDPHVLLDTYALESLEQIQDDDLYHGPMIYDNLDIGATHMEDVWRDEMWGIWSVDMRYMQGRKFEIPAHGLGLFACRRESWLGFNKEFRGFGGEEWYIHEKYRKAGRRVWCIPQLRWLHRFGRPDGVPYPLTRYNKVRNYIIGHQELGLPLDRVYAHFVTERGLPITEWEAALRHDEAPTVGGCNCPTKTETANMTLDARYDYALRNPSDINEHVDALKVLAEQCDTVVEFGVRNAVSSVALVASKAAHIFSFDLVGSASAKELEGLSNGRYKFSIGNSLTVDPIACDLLFIDTKHTADQLYGELVRHAPFCKRWIALHDTVTFGEIGEDGGPGLLPGLRRWLAENKNWSVIAHHTHNNGFMILSCDSRDKPDLPSIWQQAKNFSRAVAEHVADGLKTVDADRYRIRLETCATCPARRDDRCSECGCFIAEKAKWRSSFCPLGQWSAQE